MLSGLLLFVVGVDVVVVGDDWLSVVVVDGVVNAIVDVVFWCC